MVKRDECGKEAKGAVYEVVLIRSQAPDKTARKSCGETIVVV